MVHQTDPNQGPIFEALQVRILDPFANAFGMNPVDPTECLAIMGGRMTDIETVAVVMVVVLLVANVVLKLCRLFESVRIRAQHGVFFSATASPFDQSSSF